jgi:hypothetical protein
MLFSDELGLNGERSEARNDRPWGKPQASAYMDLDFAGCPQ